MNLKPGMSLRRVPLAGAMAEIAAALHARSGLHERWDARAFAELLAMPGAGGELAMSGDEPVGLILWRIAADEAEILTICVLPEARRMGAGRFLMDGAVAALETPTVRTLYLEVAEDNTPAIALYHACGFCAQGRRPGYYRTEAGATDALILLKAL
jgi:ribosomal-protein-alanine N-acetyltransferase